MSVEGNAGDPASRKGNRPEDSEDCLGFCSQARAMDLGDLVIVLLASTLAGLRDRLMTDGFDRAAEVVCDLVEIADDYLSRRSA